MTEEEIAENHPDVILMDGFKGAILGIAISFGKDPVVAYSYNKCIHILMEESDMSYDEANEFFEYNCIGASVNDQMPVFII